MRPSSMKIDAVADLARELHLVRDDEHRHPVVGEVAHDDQHLADELGVERGGDLVEEHHVRLHHQRAGDRDALLLAARELVRMLVAPSPSSPTRASSSRARASASRAGQLADPPRREREVVDHLQVREEVELLEDHPDPLPDRRDVDALAR